MKNLILFVLAAACMFSCNNANQNNPANQLNPNYVYGGDVYCDGMPFSLCCSTYPEFADYLCSSNWNAECIIRDYEFANIVNGFPNDTNFVGEYRINYSGEIGFNRSTFQDAVYPAPKYGVIDLSALTVDFSTTHANGAKISNPFGALNHLNLYREDQRMSMDWSSNSGDDMTQYNELNPPGPKGCRGKLYNHPFMYVNANEFMIHVAGRHFSDNQGSLNSDTGCDSIFLRLYR